MVLLVLSSAVTEPFVAVVSAFAVAPSEAAVAVVEAPFEAELDGSASVEAPFGAAGALSGSTAVEQAQEP